MTTPDRSFAKIATIAIALLLVALSWNRPIEAMAESQLSDGLKRSLVSFASARAQRRDFGDSGHAGGGAAAGRGGVAVGRGSSGPDHDLVEAFSTVMLTASVAFGMQLLLLNLGANVLASAAVSGIAVAWALLYHLGRSPGWLSR
jgi:hypothetical protein